eukprot:5552336-Amphidinium_carterae.1
MAPKSRSGRMMETNSSKGSGRLVRPPPTPSLSLPLRLRRKVTTTTERGTGSTGMAEWKKVKSWRGRISFAAGRWRLLAWRGQIVESVSGFGSGKCVDSGKPLK